MSTPAAPNTLKALPQDKFTVARAVHGHITVLTMAGTLNDTFEGRKLAESIRTRKVIVDMRDVRRFASWGMSEWMDFLRINAKRDLYLVECSTYAVSQINLVTGLLGHGKLVSFYASFRCGSCSEERESLFLVPRDRDAIRELPGSHQECVACGGKARLEEYPESFFETIADRASFDIDDEVLAHLRSQLNYDITPDVSRFRAHRSVSAGYTYLRLSGSMSLLPSHVLATASNGATVVDLEGISFDPTDVAAWRTYVEAAMLKVKSLQLLNCPSGFLETIVDPADLHDKLKIRTFSLAYDCLRCETTTAHMVDVAEHLEQLVAGTAPTARCPACKSLLVAALTHDQITRFRSLPARERDVALDKFLVKARSQPSDELENCLNAPMAPLPVATAQPGRTTYLVLGLASLIVAGLALGYALLKRNPEPAPIVIKQDPGVVQPVKPTFTRPDWIISDIPSSAYCHDAINRLMCVGVSSYRPTREEGVAEADDAALEELVSTVGLKVSDQFLKDNVMPGYSDARSKALAALQTADVDRTSAAYLAAEDVIRKARRRVVGVLHATGGAAVPTQRSDWYWEEYAGEHGRKNETLVFVRYDVTLDAVRSLVDAYSTSVAVVGSKAVTAFPGLAWYPDFAGGAMITKAGRSFAAAGVTPGSIVVAVGEQPVNDATALTRRLDEPHGTGALKLTVKTGDVAPRVVSVSTK